MLCFLCGNDEDLSESGYCSVRELRGLLTNRWDGVEVSLEEVGEVHEMIHENDSDSEEEEEEEEGGTEAVSPCGRGCGNTAGPFTCYPWNRQFQENTMEQFNCCPCKVDTLFGMAVHPDFDFPTDADGYPVDDPIRMKDLLELKFPGLHLDPLEAEEISRRAFERQTQEDRDSDEDSEEDSEEEEEPSATDTRPLINKEWIEQNPERWEELQEKPEHCPVCLESEGVLWDGRLNLIEGDDTRCTHWFCHECFEHIQGMTDGMRRRCPMCKDQW
jgi:hypothetical protein